MAGAFSQVDLSQLSPPSVVDPLNFEVVLSEMVSDLRARDPSFSALVESDPAFKVLEVAAYREVLVRQRVNDAARAVMLSSATGTDLDQIAANYGVTRLLVEPANATATPPTLAIYESDTELRSRTTLSLEGYTSAGSAGSYVFHALSASGDVLDVSATSPVPGQAVIYVLSRQGEGTAPASLLATVSAALNADKVRPMTDQVYVFSAGIVRYQITAQLVIYPGPDASVVLAAAREAVGDYAASQHKMGYDVTLSGIYAALHQPGVQRVNLSEPASNITISDGQAGYCTAITLTTASAVDV